MKIQYPVKFDGDSQIYDAEGNIIVYDEQKYVDEFQELVQIINSYPKMKSLLKEILSLQYVEGETVSGWIAIHGLEIESLLQDS